MASPVWEPTVDRPGSIQYWQSFAMTATNSQGKTRTGITIYPTSETNPGSCDVALYQGSLTALYGISEESVASFLASLIQSELPARYWGGGVRIPLTTLEQAREFERRYREFDTAIRSGEIPPARDETEA